MEQGSSSSPQTGGQVPWCPQSFLSMAARTSAARISQAVGQEQRPQERLLLWMLLGLCTCLFAISSHNTVFGRFLLFIQTLGYLLQVGKCLVWGCGWSWEGRKGVRSMFFGLSEASPLPLPLEPPWL